MSKDPSSLEAELRKLHAAALDENMLTRLEACAAGDWATPGPGELHYEHRLRAIAPAKIPASLMQSLMATLETVPFPVEQKIVRFPKRETTVRHGNRGWWSAAAAVAITGALTAFFVPLDSRPTKVVGNTQPSVVLPSPAINGLVPAGFNRGLSEASDEGVIWQSNDRPHRVVKVVYLDRVTMKDGAGRTYQMEQPRVEYILVPAETD